MNEVPTALAAALVLFCVGCDWRAQVGSPSLTAVRVQQVELASASSASRYSATVNPASRVEMAFRVGGYVDHLAQVSGMDGRKRDIQEGDEVTQGMVLASVRKKDYEQKLLEAKAALSEARAAREQAQLDYERASNLARSHSISRSEADAANTRLHTARARVQGAAARVEEARTALADAELVSPLDGTVLKRSLEVGSLVNPGVAGFVVADTRSVKVIFGMADSDLDALKMGSAQSLTTEAVRGRVFEGEVTRIAPSADAKSHVFEVEVTVPNTKNELKAGMVAALSLPTTKRSDPVPLLPLNAVLRSPKHADGFAVFIVDGKEGNPLARIREVELGDFMGSLIPVRSGLKPGERVIVAGANLVSDGQPVRVVP